MKYNLYTQLNKPGSFLNKYVVKPTAGITATAFAATYLFAAAASTEAKPIKTLFDCSKNPNTAQLAQAPVPNANAGVDSTLALYKQVQAQYQASQESLANCRTAQVKADSLAGVKKVKSKPSTPKEVIVSDKGENYVPDGGNTLLPTTFEAGNAQEAAKKLADAKPLHGTKITYQSVDLESQLGNTIRPVMGERFGAGKDSAYQTIDNFVDTTDYTFVPHVNTNIAVDTVTGETLTVYDTTGTDSVPNTVARAETTNHTIPGGLEGKAVTDSMSRDILVKMLNGDTLTEEESNYKLAEGNYGLLLKSDKKDPRGMNTANTIIRITGKTAGQYTQAEVDSMRMHLITGYEELLQQYEAEKAKTVELEGALTTTQEELSATQSQADSLKAVVNRHWYQKPLNIGILAAGLTTIGGLLLYFLFPEDPNPQGRAVPPVSAGKKGRN